MSGGLHNDMAVHDFDMARFLVGSEVSEVYCKGSCKVSDSSKKQVFSRFVYFYETSCFLVSKSFVYE